MHCNDIDRTLIERSHKVAIAALRMSAPTGHMDNEKLLAMLIDAECLCDALRQKLFKSRYDFYPEMDGDD